MKIAVVGCGHWGQNLVRNFFDLGVLFAISDENKDLAKKFSTNYSVPSLTFEEILDSNCDGVVIAAPAEMHAALAIRAFGAKKHVYVEKPLALTLLEADSIIAAGIKAKKQLMVGHLLQYHPAYIRLREIVNSKMLGDLKYIYSNRLSFGKIRTFEDVIWSFAPHDISMILGLTNQKVRSVTCSGSKILQSGIADIASIYLEFNEGLRGHVSCSWMNPFKEQKLVVIGDDASAVFDDTLDWNQKLSIYNNSIINDSGEINLIKSNPVYEKIPSIEPLRAECSYFIDLINGNVKSRTDGAEGKSVLKVLELASESLEKFIKIYA